MKKYFLIILISCFSLSLISCDLLPYYDGSKTYENGAEYIGELRFGKRDGQGTYTFPSGQKYVGEFKDGEYDGQGTYTYPDGAKYVGEWKDDELID